MEDLKDPAPTADSLKELGNTAVRNQNFEQAILHYTHAIKLDPNNFTLHSNRSFAFLKVKQYCLAFEDANETIRLNSEWPKGYFRKGEVEFAAEHYWDAYNSYQKALELKPDDENLMEAVKRANEALKKDRTAEERVPWLGAAVGIIIGATIMVADALLTTNPTHPILMSLVTIAVAMIGYGIARTYRYYIKCQRDGMLQVDPLTQELDESDSSQKDKKTHNRYTRSQARQRYKKGKM